MVTTEAQGSERAPMDRKENKTSTRRTRRAKMRRKRKVRRHVQTREEVAARGGGKTSV